jgi:epoxyqueuosine reductase
MEVSTQSIPFSGGKVIVLLVEEEFMERARDSRNLDVFFGEKLARIGYDGVVGVARFKKVYDELMPSQRSKLEDICTDHFQDLRESGSIICVGIAYPERAIDCIDVRLSNGTADKRAWNMYAREYHRLNSFLNAICKDISDRFEGVPILATVEGVAVKNVEDYYGMTVSHRVVAENAGLGWRGKNELVINERFSCALRFASVITGLPLVHARKVETSCGQCKACLEACPFLRNKGKLKDYKESCRRYIVQLGLEGEVCGKCIKACYRHSVFSSRFRLR